MLLPIIEVDDDVAREYLAWCHAHGITLDYAVSEMMRGSLFCSKDMEDQERRRG